MTSDLLRAAKAALSVCLVTLAANADTLAIDAGCFEPAAKRSERVDSAPGGRLLVLPGVGNTRFHLAGFVERARAQLPGFHVEVRTWGVPFLTLHNLRAHERNVATAEEIAAEIAEWRDRHPGELFYLVGYSGGGGMAALAVSFLPDDVTVDRLILVAPAISPDYPVEREVLPHVGEYMVNYWSEQDLQVGWGTKTFGTIDRVKTESAGATGFSAEDPELLQWRWTPEHRELGHRGNHLSYLGRRWQAAALHPALEPQVSADELGAYWDASCDSI
jgi:pimeloyl-ACP methyl ester carboxylesterase